VRAGLCIFVFRNQVSESLLNQCLKLATLLRGHIA
jgi:hypothetical protein